MMLEHTISQTELVEIEGVFNVDIVLAGKEAFEALVESHRNTVFDLSGVTYMDGSALGMLVTLERKARQSGGSVKIQHPSSCVLGLLALTRLKQRFGVAE